MQTQKTGLDFKGQNIFVEHGCQVGIFTRINDLPGLVANQEPVSYQRQLQFQERPDRFVR